MSQEVVDAADLDGVGLTAIGPIELKGVSQPLSLLSGAPARLTALGPDSPHVSDRSS